jgi:hypothetical protein
VKLIKNGKMLRKFDARNMSANIGSMGDGMLPASCQELQDGKHIANKPITANQILAWQAYLYT